MTNTLTKRNQNITGSRPHYYAYPGMHPQLHRIISKEFGLPYSDIFLDQKAEHIRPRYFVFFLETLRGKTHQQIADEYLIPRPSITYAVGKLRTEMRFYPETAQRLGKLAMELGCVDAFNTLYTENVCDIKTFKTN